MYNLPLSKEWLKKLDELEAECDDVCCGTIDPSLDSPEHNLQRPLDLDPGTYGDSKAAVVLTKILNEIGDHKLARKVGNYFCYYCRGVMQIATLTDEEIRTEFFHMWKERFKLLIEEAKMPEKVASYLRNIMKAKMQDTIRGLENE